MGAIEKYSFFDSTLDDERFYSAEDFAEFFRQVISTGILNGGSNLQVVCDSTNMNIQIRKGYAWLEGYSYRIENEPLILTLDTADSTLDRIDRVVIRLDKRLENRYIKAFILKGTPSENPVSPAITRDENIFEIALAQVRVIAGKSFIIQENISDERFNNEVCGLASSLIDIDTTHIFTQFTEYLKNYREEKDVEYTTWVQSRQQDYINWTTNKIADYENWTSEEKVAYKSWMDNQKQNFLLWLDSIQKEAIKTHTSQLIDDVGFLLKNETEFENLDQTIIEIPHNLNCFPDVRIRMSRGFGLEGFGRFSFGDTEILCKNQIEYINNNNLIVYINEKLGYSSDLIKIDNNNYRIDYTHAVINIRLEG